MKPLTRPLRFQAEWGMANFYRVFGWIAHHTFVRLGRAGLCQIHTGQGWVDNVQALVAGDVDVTIATPREFAAQALLGVGQFAGSPHPEIRALGVLPHDDAILLAVPAESPIRDIEDILDQRYPLRLAAPPDDGYCNPGWTCQTILDEYGLTRDTIESFGGRYLYREFPRLCPGLVLTGEANAVMNEAIMLPDWRDLAERRPIRFLSVRDDILRTMETRHHFRRRDVPAGRFPGQSEPIRTVDYSGWMLIATTALPDHVAYLLTSIMVEARADLERLYNSAPVHLSPLTYPVRPEHMSATGEVPLHPGAEQYYRERGLHERWTPGAWTPAYETSG